MKTFKVSIFERFLSSDRPPKPVADFHVVDLDVDHARKRAKAECTLRFPGYRILGISSASEAYRTDLVGYIQKL
jgi:hypothetical protein